MAMRFFTLLVKENSYGWRGLSLKSRTFFIEQCQADVEFKVLLHLFLNVYVHLLFSLLEKGTMFEKQSMGFYLFFTQNLVSVQNKRNSTVVVREVMVLHKHWEESCRQLSVLAKAPSLLPFHSPYLFVDTFLELCCFNKGFFLVSTLKFHSQRL